ncbi:MAG TPA: hypothetical protein VIK90_04730 [Limnochordales bacterium]
MELAPLWIAAAAGLLVQLAGALLPVRLTVRWRATLRRSGHLAVRAHLQYAAVHLHLRGAARVAPPFVGGRAAGQVRVVPALGPVPLAGLALERRLPTRRTPAEPDRRARPPRGPRARPGSRWRRAAASAFAAALRGRLRVTRLWVAIRVGTSDAATAALGAAAARAAASAALARLARVLGPGSAPPRIAVRPAYGRPGLEARGEVVLQVRAAALVVAAAAAARRALAPAAAVPAQRASSQRAAA